MLDSPYLLPFDLFEQLVKWLGTSMQAYRKGRRFLENNRMLLRTETQRQMEKLIRAEVEEKVELKQHMHYHQALLSTAQQRGGTEAAIREAYINAYGGFVLDLPEWLDELDAQRTQLTRLRRPERTKRSHVQLLRDALGRAIKDSHMEAEIVAELFHQLADVLLQGALAPSDEEQQKQYKEAIGCYESARSIYTYEHYPLQYARTSLALGTAYQRYGSSIDSQELIERALSCYKSATWVYKRHEHTERWALLQTQMGNAYAQRDAGGRQNNLEYALHCHQKALHVLDPSTSLYLWARVQANLGDSYQARIEGTPKENLDCAYRAYHAALQMYNRKDTPKEWAELQVKIAQVFQRAEYEHPKGLTYAIVCFDAALQVYSPDAYPVEYATTQWSLAQAHARSGNSLGQRNQARQCHQEALRVFTSDAFPREHQQVQMCLQNL